MAIELDDVECRVLGVLMEKALSQPAGYPLTLNAIVLGANQKQNREPVLDLTEQEVARAVHSLQQRRIAKQAPPSAGSRANRFEHDVVERFHWDRREQAVMAELILRGRQTAGELRTRASRMVPLADLPAAKAVLQGLMDADPPFVRELPREPGRSATRNEHLLSPQSQASDEPVGSPGPPMVRTGDAQEPRTDAASALANRVGELEARVGRLERMMDSGKDDRKSIDPHGGPGV